VRVPGDASCCPSAIVLPTTTRWRRPGPSSGRRRRRQRLDADDDPLAATGGLRAGDVVGGQRLDADDARHRRERLDDRRAAGDQPAAADRHEQQVELAGVLVQLQRDGPRARHHVRIVERVHEVQPALLRERERQRLTILAVAVVADDVRAIGLRRGELARLGGGRGA
jgi:hypothetical protein